MTDTSQPKEHKRFQKQVETAQSGRIVLSNHPFQTRLADPATLYTSTDHAQLIAQLNHYLSNTRLMILVSGPQGSGKTALLHQYLAKLPETFNSLMLDAGQGLTGVELLSSLADHFDVAPRQASAGGSAYLQMFKNLNSEDDQPLLLLDNAHLLDERTLQLVTKLSDQGLRLILFTDTELEQRLCKLQLSWCNGNTQVLRVKPLDDQQILCYLRQRFELAGYNGPLPFSDEEVSRIRTESGGLPGNINRMARQILESRPMVVPQSTSNYVPRSESHGASRLMIVGGILLSVLAAAALILFFKDRINLTASEADQEMVNAWTSESVTTALATPMLEVPSARSPAREEIEADKNQDEQSLIQAVLEPSPEPSTADTQAESPRSDDLPSPPLEPQPAVGTASLPPTQTETEVEQQAELNRVPTTSSPATNTQANTPSDSPTPEVVEQVPASSEETQADSSRSTEGQAPKPAQTPQTEASLAPGNNQDLLKRNPRHYTMQLIAGHKKSAVLKLADKFEIQSKSVYYEINRKGQPWYALVYEDYPTRQAALDALGALPQGLKKRKPWIRRFSAIQKSIRESEQSTP